MALTNLEKIRIEIADNEPGLYVISDDEIEYLLEKNLNSIQRTTIDACRIILMKLSQRGDETVDIFSLKNGRTAAEYRESLKLFLRDSQLNSSISAKGYFGGISRSDMQANDSNTDNNTPVKLNTFSRPSTSFFEYK